MDIYAQCLPEDGKDIRATLEQFGSVVFPLAVESHTTYLVLLCKNFMSIGVMPFGGNPRGRVYVALYGRNLQNRDGAEQVGCSHFVPKETHWSYFAEKLRLDDESAQVFAELWKNMWEPTEEEKVVDNLWGNNGD